MLKVVDITDEISCVCGSLTVAVLDVHGGLSLQQRRQQLCGSCEGGVVQRREPDGGQRSDRERERVSVPSSANLRQHKITTY